MTQQYIQIPLQKAHWTEEFWKLIVSLAGSDFPPRQPDSHRSQSLCISLISQVIIF